MASGARAWRIGEQWGRLMKVEYLGLIALITCISSASWATGPIIKLSPSSGHPKITDQVNGSGFTPYEAVDIYWDVTDVLLVATNGSGHFSNHPFTVPKDATPGQHWVTAVGRKSGNAAQATFNLTTEWAERGFDSRGKRTNPYENVLSANN